jgi:hypothetical protein
MPFFKRKYSENTRNSSIDPKDELTVKSSCFTKGNFNLDNDTKNNPSQENKLNNNAAQFKKFLEDFIAELKFLSSEFKFKSKKSIPGDPDSILETICITYGLRVFNIIIPKSSDNLTIDNPLFKKIAYFIANPTNNKSNNTIYSKQLFIVPSKTISIVELETYPDATQSSNNLTIYNSKAFGKEANKNFKNLAKQHTYQFKKTELLESDSSYYFIKNLIQNYLQDCLLPDNSSPHLFEGLLATFIHKLKLSGLKFTIEKINDKNESINNSQLIKTSSANFEKKLEYVRRNSISIASTLERNRKNNLASGLTTGNLTIFHRIQYKNSVSTLQKVIEHSGTSINSTKKTLLPVADEKGIAVIEVITAKNDTSTLIIHDPNQILKLIRKKINLIAKENQYRCKWNPNKDYGSDWQSQTQCQLAAYHFLKKSILSHLKPNDPITIRINKSSNVVLPKLILDEIKANLNLTNDQEIDRAIDCLSINRCDGGMFNLKNFVKSVRNHLSIINLNAVAPKNILNREHNMIPDETQKKPRIK